MSSPPAPADSPFTVKYDAMENFSIGPSYRFKLNEFYGGKEKLRLDDLDSKDNSSSYILIVRGVDSYRCIIYRGAWLCIESPTNETDIPNLYDPLEPLGGAYSLTTSESTMDVANTTAICFGRNTPEEVAKECYSKEGVPLYISDKVNGYEDEVTATTYLTNVSDDDFNLPGPVESTAPEGNASQ